MNIYTAYNHKGTVYHDSFIAHLLVGQSKSFFFFHYASCRFRGRCFHLEPPLATIPRCFDTKISIRRSAQHHYARCFVGFESSTLDVFDPVPVSHTRLHRQDTALNTPNRKETRVPSGVDDFSLIQISIKPIFVQRH